MITKFDIHQYIDKFYIFYPYKRKKYGKSELYNINYIKNITINNGWYGIERIIINTVDTPYDNRVKTISHVERKTSFMEFVKHKKFLTPQEFVDNHPNDVIGIFNIIEDDEYRDIFMDTLKDTNVDMLLSVNKYNI